MIYQLTGNLIFKQAHSIVLECNNVGYEIYMSRIDKMEEGKEYTVYTYESFGETYRHLFGFLSEEEKNMFYIFKSIKGFGCRSIISILDKLTVEEIVEIVDNQDIDAFLKLPYITPQNVNEIMKELSKKFHKDFQIDITKKFNSVKSALKNMGYTAKAIAKVLQIVTFKNRDEGQIIKEAVHELNNLYV